MSTKILKLFVAMIVLAGTACAQEDDCPHCWGGPTKLAGKSLVGLVAEAPGKTTLKVVFDNPNQTVLGVGEFNVFDMGKAPVNEVMEQQFRVSLLFINRTPNLKCRILWTATFTGENNRPTGDCGRNGRGLPAKDGWLDPGKEDQTELVCYALADEKTSGALVNIGSECQKPVAKSAVKMKAPAKTQ